MKRILATLTLMCALCVSAFAGEIPTCSPSPTAATVTGEVPTNGSESVAGNMPTGGFSESSETEPSVLTDVLLTLVDLIVR
jgi:hypothetical protein